MLNMLRMGPILNGTNTEWPKMIRAIQQEKKIIQDWVEKYAIDGIISDNRLGVLKKIPCFITHQLNDNR
jgi:hypothetical protein